MEAPDSDHSLTWEDFFGSTTDLTPTLIGIFDSFLVPKTKSSTVERDDVKRKMTSPVVDSPPKDPRLIAGGVKLPGLTDEDSNSVPQVNSAKKSMPKMSYVSRLKSFGLKRGNAYDEIEPTKEKEMKSNNDRVPTTNANIDKVNNETQKQQFQGRSISNIGSSFENLSPNVKRMLSSVDAEDCTKAVTQLKKPSLAGIGRSSYRSKQSNIPLMGTTSKITQSGVEIVTAADIYDKPSNTLTKVNVNSNNLAKDWSPKTMSSFSPRKKSQLKLVTDEEMPSVYDVPTNPLAIYDIPSTKKLKVVEDVSISEPIALITVDKPIDILEANQVSKTLTGSNSIGDLQNDRLNVPVSSVTRPLSMSSIASSSSTSSSGVQHKGGANSAYLASIESLDDHSDGEYGKNSRASQSMGISETGGKLSDGNLQLGRAPTPPRPRYCDPNLSPLEKVCTEIVDTENIYVEDLRQVVEGYLYTWRDNGTFVEEQLNDLFSNIEEIYHFNKKFSQNLNECNLEAIAIAKCFVNHSSGFSIYTQYCTGYPGIMATLARLVGAPDSAQPFKAQQTILGHALPLGSYLLKPVQRILKYHLLLQNLVKQCKSHDTEYALHKMTGIANYINDMKRRHEHAVRVQEIQSLLYGWNGQDLTTYGELCAEGTFRVFGAKALRHVFLFDKMLLLTKNKEYGMLAYKSHIMCNNLMLVESIQGQPLSFHVIPFDCPRMQVTLQARSIQHKREWTLLLKRVILENYNAVIPSHARQLVMELGQNKTDDDILAEKSNVLISHSSMRKQMSAPEYLEKRKIDRDRRKSFESGLRYRLKRTTTRKEPSYDSVAENEEIIEKEHDNTNASYCSCKEKIVENLPNENLCDSCRNICHDCLKKHQKSFNDSKCNCRIICDDCQSLKDDECSCTISKIRCSNCNKSVSVVNDSVKEIINCTCSNEKNHKLKSHSENSLEMNSEKNIDKCYKCNHLQLHKTDVHERVKNVYDRLDINDDQLLEMKKTCLKCHGIRENIITEDNNEYKSNDNDCHHALPRKSISKDDLQAIDVSKILTQRRNSEPGISNMNMEELHNEDKKNICEKCGKMLSMESCASVKSPLNDGRKLRKKESEKSVNIEVKMYNSKTVPKKITKIKKNRAKTLRHRVTDPTAKFYTDLTDNVLHISESTDSINTLNSNINNIHDDNTDSNIINIPDGMDEETYKSLIQKTDSFKKSEIERDKLITQTVSKDDKNTTTFEESDNMNILHDNFNSLGDQEDAFESCEDGSNERPLELIISQLLMQNREFQKILKKHQLRNGANRRHQRLLKSYSNPEKTTQQIKDSQNKIINPKYTRQFSNIETIPVKVSDEKAEQVNDSQEEHIYETLMITSQKLIDESENLNKKNAPESDYVYLCFDGKKSIDAYTVPKNINSEDTGEYAVPNVNKNQPEAHESIVGIRKEPMQRNENTNYIYNYENASEVWKRISNDTVVENKPYCDVDEDISSQSPNLPEIWLDRQKEHFSTPREKKSGSLPRSFQLALNDDENKSSQERTKFGPFKKIYLNKEGKVLHSDRPFTIASDRSEISYDDIESFIKTNDDDSILKFPRDSISSNRSSFLDESIDEAVDSASRSTLELEAEIERCYKNQFGFGQFKSTLNASINSVNNKIMNRSISSSMEVMDDKRENETSQEDISIPSLHPEHRIYKPTSNVLSLKGVLNRLKSKVKSSQENVNVEESSNASKKNIYSKNHPKNLFQRLISVKTEEHTDIDTLENEITAAKTKNNNLKVEEVDGSTNSISKSCNNISSSLKSTDINMSQSVHSASTYTPNKVAARSVQDLNNLPIYKQGSRLLGARIAQSDYADPNILKIKSNSDLNTVNVLINKNSVRPDSLLSNSSHFTSSSEGCISSNVVRNHSFLYKNRTNNNNDTKKNDVINNNNNNNNSNDDENVSKTSDILKQNIQSSSFKLSSDESFYERSFEEIENILDNEVFRDSAIYSEPDDGSLHSIDEKRPSRVLKKSTINKITSTFIREEKNDPPNCAEKSICLNNNNSNGNFGKREMSKAKPMTHTISTNIVKITKDISKIDIESKTSKLAPPIPVKPIFSKIAQHNTIVKSKDNKNVEDTLQKIVQKSAEDINVFAEKPKPTIPRPTFQRSSSSNINIKRMSFERCSLDSSAISRRSKSVSTQKITEPKESSPLYVEEITITKSVQERRKEIEMLAENHVDRTLITTFGRSMSFKASSSGGVSKIQPPSVKSNKIQDNTTKMDNPTDLEPDKMESMRGGWVKQVVNRFQ